MLVGDHDTVTGPPVAELIQQLVSSAKVVVLPRVGHSPHVESPHVERPEEVAGLVRTFTGAIDR